MAKSAERSAHCSEVLPLAFASRPLRKSAQLGFSAGPAEGYSTSGSWIISAYAVASVVWWTKESSRQWKWVNSVAALLVAPIPATPAEAKRWPNQIDRLRSHVQVWTGNVLQVIDLSVAEWINQQQSGQLAEEIRRDAIEMRGPIGIGRPASATKTASTLGSATTASGTRRMTSSTGGSVRSSMPPYVGPPPGSVQPEATP